MLRFNKTVRARDHWPGLFMSRSRFREVWLWERNHGYLVYNTAQTSRHAPAATR